MSAGGADERLRERADECADAGRGRRVRAQTDACQWTEASVGGRMKAWLWDTSQEDGRGDDRPDEWIWVLEDSRWASTRQRVTSAGMEGRPNGHV